MTCDENGYNGWMNRNTWVINLWMSNESSIEDMITEWIENQDHTDDKDTMIGSLSQFIESFIDEELDTAWDSMPDSFGKSLIQDMMDSDQIDYVSIAEGYLEDYVQEKEED